jgi:dihydrofolate reductase
VSARIRASVFVGASVDGFIARPDGAFDFLPDSPEPHGYEEFFASVDALLMGRKTYETVVGFETWPYGRKPVFVLSRKPLASVPEGATVVHLSGSPHEIMAQLAARGIGHVYVDGGQTVQQFLRAGLIDRITVTRVPVLIGSGISIFGELDADVRLEHVATRSYPSGLVQSESAVLPIGSRPDPHR